MRDRSEIIQQWVHFTIITTVVYLDNSKLQYTTITTIAVGDKNLIIDSIVELSSNS